MSIIPPRRNTTTPAMIDRWKIRIAPARVTRKPNELMMLGCTRLRMSVATTGFSSRTNPFLNHSGMGASAARRPAAARAAAGPRLPSFERDRPLNMGFDHLFEPLLTHRPDDCLDDLSVLEEEEAWNRPHRILLRGALVHVDVDLADLQAPLVLVGELVDSGRDHLAGTAPFGPEVDQGERLRLL